MKMRIAVAVATVAAAMGFAPTAHADGVLTDAELSYVADTYYATCATLDDGTTGNVRNDSTVVLGIALAIANHYGITPDNAIDVENEQVLEYCPRHWAQLVAVGESARGGYYEGPSSEPAAPPAPSLIYAQ